ncbi:ABC transporter permease [Cupriavidus basilensis]
MRCPGPLPPGQRPSTAARRNATGRPGLHHAAWLLAWPVPLALLLAWYVAARFAWIPPQVLPAPDAVWHTLAELYQSGELQANLAVSALRVAGGFALGLAGGLALGVAMGLSPGFRDYVYPTFKGLQPGARAGLAAAADAVGGH